MPFGGFVPQGGMSFQSHSLDAPSQGSLHLSTQHHSKHYLPFGITTTTIPALSLMRIRQRHRLDWVHRLHALSPTETRSFFSDRPASRSAELAPAGCRPPFSNYCSSSRRLFPSLPNAYHPTTAHCLTYMKLTHHNECRAPSGSQRATSHMKGQ